MKKSLKSLTMMLLFLLSATAVVFAGQGTTEEGTASSDEVVEISIANWDIGNSFPDGDDDPMRAFFEEKFKIKMNPVNVTWGDANEKLNIWAASGQLPDLIGAIATVGDGRYFQWIEDGVIRPLPSNLAQWPQLKKNIDFPEVQAFNVDGETYLLPRMTYADSSWWAMDRGILVRKDWMQKLGISEPKSAAEFIEMCVRFAKDDPDGNGADDTMGLTTAGLWVFWSQCFTGYGFTDGRWVKDGGEYHMANTRRNTFELFQFARELYQKGGLDLDFATSNTDSSIENFASGRAGVLIRQVSPKHLQKTADVWSKLQPDKNFADYVEILHPWAVQGQEHQIFIEKAYWSETYVESAVDDLKMSRILDLYNFLYTEEGIYMSEFGMEGVEYENINGQIELLKTDADGNPVKAWGTYPLMTGGFAWLAAWNGDLVQYINPSIPKVIRDITTKERDYRLSNWKIPEIDWAVQAINVPEKQDMSLDMAADWTKFIIDDSGKSDEELYQDLLANWKANGYDATVAAVTKAAAEMGK